MALKTWLPEQKMALKTGYRNRIWSSNMVTGTKPGHQIWLPEQKVDIKYGYRNKFIICVIFIEIEAWASNIPVILTFSVTVFKGRPSRLPLASEKLV